MWYVPYYHPKANDSSVAWKMAATFIPISYGWAAGDVSLAAYIQSSLARVESKSRGISALGAVMSFLYVTYVSSPSFRPSALFSLGPHSSSQTSRGRTPCFSSPGQTDEGVFSSLLSPLGSPFKPSTSPGFVGSLSPSARKYRRHVAPASPPIHNRSLATEILNQLGQRHGKSRLDDQCPAADD